MKRVVTALVLIPTFLYLILWSPKWAFLAAVAGVSWRADGAGRTGGGGGGPEGAGERMGNRIRTRFQRALLRHAQGAFEFASVLAARPRQDQSGQRNDQQL